MINYKIIIKNIVSNWISTLVSIIIGFFIMPFIVHHLGDEMYGIWVLVISTVGYGSLLDIGIRSSIVKYVSQYNATKDVHNLNRIFNTSLFIYSIIGIIIILTAIFLSTYFSMMFNILPANKNDAESALMIIGFSLALSFPFGVFGGFLNGIQRYDITNGISISLNIIRTIFILLFLSMGFKLITLSIITLLCAITGHFITLYFSFKHLPDLKINFKNVNKETFKNISRYGGYSFLIIIASKIMYETDSIVIGIFLPVSAITFYAIANNLIRYLRQISYGFGNVFNPAASELEAKNESERIQQLVIYGTKYSLLIILPIAFTFIFLGKEFISIWMGEKYVELSGTVLIILSVSQIIAMSQFSPGSILYGLNKHKYLSFMLLFEAFFNIILSIILIKKYGIIGVALGTAIPEVFIHSCILPLYVLRVTKLSIDKYLKEAFYPPLINIIPFIFLIYFSKSLYRPTLWSSLIFEISICLIVYVITSLFTCFNRKQRSAIGDICIKRLKGITV